MRRYSIGLIGLALGCGLTAGPSAAPSSTPPTAAPAALQEWARGASPLPALERVDNAQLSAFGELIGDARVVGFGESEHGLHEFPEMRNKLFRYLVEEKGFRAIVLESGVLEGRLVERYIQGDTTLTPEQVLSRGFTHGMGPWRESLELIEWMKEYNAKQKNPKDKVHFLGMDLTVRGDAPDVILAEISPYLKKVDPTYHKSTFLAVLDLAGEAGALTAKVERGYQSFGVPYIEPDLLDGFTSISFEALSPEKQKKLAEDISALASNFKDKKELYIRKSSEEEFAWSYHLALVAGQTMRNLASRQKYPKIPDFDKNIELLKKLYSDPVKELKINQSHLMKLDDIDGFKEYFKGRESRELALAGNVQWASQTYGKALVYAHNGHLIKAEMDVKVGPLAIGKAGAKGAGEFIAEFLGDQYFLIVGTMDKLVDQASGTPLTQHNGGEYAPTESCRDCLEKLLVQSHPAAPMLLIGLPKKDPALRASLDKEREHRWQAGFQRYNPARSYDAIYLIQKARAGFRLAAPEAEPTPR
jgi:erythromycin esterase-like protein